jgi:hypothetical protein
VELAIGKFSLYDASVRAQLEPRAVANESIAPAARDLFVGVGFTSSSTLGSENAHDNGESG